MSRESIPLSRLTYLNAPLVRPSCEHIITEFKLFSRIGSSVVQVCQTGSIHKLNVERCLTHDIVAPPLPQVAHLEA